MKGTGKDKGSGSKPKGGTLSQDVTGMLARGKGNIISVRKKG